MPQLTSLSSESTLTSALISIVVQFFINSAVIWFVVNYMMDLGAKTAFRRCLLCVFYLSGVSLISVVVLIGTAGFLHLGLLGLGASLLVYYFGAIAAIEGSIEIPSGGLTILILYTVINMGLMWGINTLTAA